MDNEYLQSAIKQFEYYKLLGERTFEQLTDEQLFWQANEESNSIAVIVKHLSGNMLSRWTDLLTTDGEKPWRDRDAEFENDLTTRSQVTACWDKGWEMLLNTLKALQPADLDRIVYIRNQGHTVLEAINRQLAHYPYHVGQIAFIGKMRADHWTSLSIPKGRSTGYNSEKFSQPQARQHFTDQILNRKTNHDDTAKGE
ncbi:DUF1572 domain-containing protein [Mucilaginibacter limnophilus]|uniref:DUF1572 domain-containing protein n=1 Tax=Mucilaginibacter limnophilus TaxID=1932778 RepID=A0A3S2ULA5_9SPHI|nr:DUF1572 domain-containing protein [Mucilaginibacter limnophilus]RVU01005.1 DUF1572 domain-containing protein [Mucilaginibacter limnophilus]